VVVAVRAQLNRHGTEPPITFFLTKEQNMQYILTQEEVNTLKQQASDEGFKRAEQIVKETLDGKDVGISINVDGVSVSIFDDTNKDNVWRKLVDLAGVVQKPKE
jgi:hypothetical protein